MKASMRMVPMLLKKCWRVDVLASEVRELATPLVELYTDDGTEGGCMVLHMSDDPLEYTEGMC